ncbi:hypothetical protein M9M90_16560 [Phenylobacterium sp. LH3H17]|uniref:hypothetical protein n=1 Tax=Phenylobacterium sp. LH3H17 TaxID=2903901 RepID=UPI0020C9C089|nr:hypothetical protein [Phenylobacterium sp. LH3H17]UTP38819.1 hypothetical protein M9M90_16560 [Phenylobacterium sp. LH3H17]
MLGLAPPNANLAGYGAAALVYLLVKRPGWPFWLALVPVVLAVPALSFALSKLWALRAA